MLLRGLAGLVIGLAAPAAGAAAGPVWQPVDVRVVYAAPELQAQLGKDNFGTDGLDRLLIDMFDQQLVFWNLRPARAPRNADVPLLTVTLSETDEAVSVRQLRFALTLEVPGGGRRIEMDELEAFGRGEYATTVLAKGKELAEVVTRRVQSRFEVKEGEYWKKARAVPVAQGVVPAPGLNRGQIVVPLQGPDRFRRYARSVFDIESSAGPNGPWNPSTCLGVGSFWGPGAQKYLILTYQAPPAQWPLEHRTIWLKERQDQVSVSTEYNG
jgi:hypothetical protein